MADSDKLLFGQVDLDFADDDRPPMSGRMARGAPASAVVSRPTPKAVAAVAPSAHDDDAADSTRVGKVDDSILSQVRQREPRPLEATSVVNPTTGQTGAPPSGGPQLSDPRIDYDLYAPPNLALNTTEYAIGLYCAALVKDGGTLQLGIGAVPDAVLKRLEGHRDLGIHTEMFSDGLVDLVERGVVTNAAKALHRGKTVTSFVMGSRRVYDFVDDNPAVEFYPASYTNDPVVISRIDRMVAINSAIQVDLTGQVCADSIGHAFYSGIGGQVDFIRGASRSNGGRPIIALPSTAAGGSVSRIVAELAPGAGVVTTRGDVHYVVTEHGIAYLHGKNIRQRAEALISIAHPDFRDELAQSARRHHFAG